MSSLSKDQIYKQSRNAYDQWCVQWREHAVANKKWSKTTLQDFNFSGVGRACLLVANGYSFEREIEVIKEKKDGVDIVCCDKTLGSLLDHGIVPQYCIVADANVSYDKYLKKWKDQLKDTVLFLNVCGNPEWPDNGNWKSVYCFINMDILKSEKEFSALSGCKNFIPAGTNVSNAMLVFMTQSDNHGRANFFGYDKYVLIGYDYAWGDNYYAFNKDGDGKINYMKHIFCTDSENDLAFTSNNLLFSAKWLGQYINTFKLPVVQCSKGTIFELQSKGDLKDHMEYRKRPEDSGVVLKLIDTRKDFKKKLLAIDKQLEDISEYHYYGFLQSC